LSGIPLIVASSTSGCGKKICVDGIAWTVSLREVPAYGGKILDFGVKKNRGRIAELYVPVVENSAKEYRTTTMPSRFSCLL
jgi:hypothetical protein